MKFKNTNSNSSNNKMLWSKGPFGTQGGPFGTQGVPLQITYSTKGTEYLATEEELIDQIKSATTVLWVRNGSLGPLRTTDLDIVAKHLNILPNPVTLITSDGDRLVPHSYKPQTVQTILNHPNILKWLTQNYDKTITHEKLGYMPIGFDFHTPKWLINNQPSAKTEFMIQYRHAAPPKIKDKIFLDAHLTISSLEREVLYATVRNNPSVICLKSQVSFTDITKIYNMYQFVLSPPGRGFDCHRTWELFLAGCIVIVKSSPLDDMFKKHKLPVAIIKNWAELNENLDQKLNQWYNDLIDLTKPEHILPKLQFEYWLISS